MREFDYILKKIQPVKFLALMLVLGISTFLVGRRTFYGSRASGTLTGTVASPAPTIAPIGQVTKKVLVLDFDPLINSTTPLHTYKSWNDPITLQNQYLTEVKNASNQYINYQIVNTQVIRDYPTKVNGFKFTQSTYLGCLTGSSQSYCNTYIDYNKLITDYNLCGQVNNGAIDEVWLWGAPYFGYNEAGMAGPNAIFINGPIITNTSCQKKLPIMGFNYERSIPEMVHSFAHRVEYTMTKVFNANDPYLITNPNSNSPIERFLTYDKQSPNNATCGNVHFTPNSAYGYDYKNMTVVSSRCNDWLNYPSTTGKTLEFDCREWGCGGSGVQWETTDYYERWWSSHIPHATGTTNGVLNNWWSYVTDYDNAFAKAQVDKEKWYTISNESGDFNADCGAIVNGNEVYFGTSPTCGSGHVAKFTFANVQIPKGALVTDSYLEFVTDGPYSNSITENITVSDGTTTSSPVSWPISTAWNSQTITKSSKIASAVQQLINSGSWASGKTINVSVSHVSGSGERRVFALERNSMAGARLVIKVELPIFADVPIGSFAQKQIESVYNAGITGGCSTNPLNYCPNSGVTRAQMAIFLLKAINGSKYSPPAVGSSTGFSDVPTSYWAAAWVKQFAAAGITGGCGTGIFCPDGNVTRAQMAVFLLKAKYGSSYSPPAVGSSTGFSDVPTSYWAAAWIKQFAALGITGGCGNGNYCPDGVVTRAQMAIFLQKTFNLP